MLEHSAMYLNVTPPYEEDTSLFPDFYTTRLGPCELPEPGWAKMSALAPAVTKKKKKNDSRTNAQNNKRDNEKIRRQQENNYIEELAELISANIADMSSSLTVKPDKCAILQEAVNQIRSIKQQENVEQQVEPVQQGEVSSSRPTILSNEVYGPLLLEALDGFLFVINSEGKVEHVTENISNFIKFTKEDVLGKIIYNFIHPGDHNNFRSNLLPMTIEWGNEQQVTNRSKSIDVRLLVKPPDNVDETVEEKQQRIICWELMHISSTQLRDQLLSADEDNTTTTSGGGGGTASGCDNSGPYLLCVASRISHRAKITSCIEQFTTKLDTSGKVICVDTSGVSEGAQQLKELKNRSLRDLVSQQDAYIVTAHLRETLGSGQATSAIYRLQVTNCKSVRVKTKSKLFRTIPHTISDTDFIMSTHAIIGENEITTPPITDPTSIGGGNSGNSSPTNSCGGVGGPLMTSIVNGNNNTIASAAASTTRNGPPTTAICSSSSSAAVNNQSGGLLVTGSNNNLSSSSSYASYPLDNDFNIITNLDFATNSTWDLDPPNWSQEGGGGGTQRPDSRQSLTPVSTPRPPSNPSYSNAPTVVQSSPFAAQPSPNPPTPSNSSSYVGGSSGFHFSPKLEPNYSSDDQQQQQQKDNINTNKIEEQQLAIMENSNRLRNLLSKPNDDKNKDKILKDLLNHEDDDNVNAGSRLLARSSGSCDGPKSSSGGGSSSIGNDLLRKLLNEKSDDDEHKSRVAGVKRQSELLQQLLRPERDNNVTGGDGIGDGGGGGDNGQQQQQQQQRDCRQDDSLLLSLGFPPSPSIGRKRHSDDNSDHPNKRSSDGSQVSSSGTGTSLRERNKMLASLLAKQPSNPQVIPPVPASVISATPQDKLPRVMSDSMKNNNAGMMNQNARMSVNRMPGRPSQQNTNYLNSVLLANSVQQRNDGRQMNQVNSNCYPSPASSTTDNNNSGWENLHHTNATNDPLLSDILDQVIEFVPDLQHMLDNSTNQNVDHQVRQGGGNLGASLVDANYSEMAAITAIQESLMQCESAVAAKGGGPPSPMQQQQQQQASLQQCNPAQVVFSTANMTQNTQFPPPPNYAQSAAQKYQQHRPLRVGTVGGANQQQFPSALTNQLLQQHQRKHSHQTQQEHKRRLLNLQKQQQLLIPSNATAANEINQIQNIDNLLNNTVAPNVSLQRSSSVPEPQLSPGYGSQRVSGQQPYSPHSQLTSPLGQPTYPQTTTVGNFTNARLSPQTQFSAQLSPRQVYPQAVAPSAANWQQAQARVSVQQNPMLSAQLTDSFVMGGRNFQRPTQQQQQQQQVPQQQQQQQQQRSINSPGSAARHSPYPADQFPPPSSPNASAFNNHQYLNLRLQRTNSAPTATTQLPGALGSPRPYPARDQHHHNPHHAYPTPPQMIPPSQHNNNSHHNHHLIYQQSPDSQYCYDQGGNMAYNGTGGNNNGGDVRGGGAGRGVLVVPPPPSQSHLQQGAGTPTSEFVRQELRAVVGARTGQPNTGRNSQQQQQQQQQLGMGQQAPQQVNELEGLGIGYDIDYYGGNATR